MDGKKRDLSTLKAKGYRFDKESADRAVAFFSRYLKHQKGEWAGKPFKLLPWQADDIIRPAFGWKRADGTRLFRQIYVEMPKKQGKSELAGGVALELTHADNEPGAEVYSCAGEKDQARIVFNIASDMNKASAHLRKRSQTFRNSIYIPKTLSTYKALSAESYSKHGYNCHGVVFDEIHSQPDKLLWNTMVNGTAARRQPMTFAITNAGEDPDTLCGELHEKTLRVNRGIVDDDSFLGVIYSADKGDDWEDERTWRKANPSYGITVPPSYFQDKVKHIKTTPSDLADFQRFHLGEWVHTTERWLPLSMWDASKGDVDEEALRGRPCITGMDLSAVNDMTAVVHVFPMDDGTFKWLPRLWIPGDTALKLQKEHDVPYTTWRDMGLLRFTEGNVVDYEAVKHELREARSKFTMKEIAYDSWNATQLVNDLLNEGFVMVEARQGYKTMSPATKEVMRLVQQKKIHHGAHKVLRWQADNMVLTKDPAGNVKPSKLKSKKKIDGIVAGIIAMDRVLRQPQDQVSVYATRPVVAF